MGKQVAAAEASAATLQMIGSIPFVLPPGPEPGVEFNLAWYHRVSLREAQEAERKGDRRKAQQIISKLEASIGTTAAHVIEATRGQRFGNGPSGDYFKPGDPEPDEPVRLTTVSKTGRPRKEGSRYDSGKLKPGGPNDRVARTRLALLLGQEEATSPKWSFMATDGGYIAIRTDAQGKQHRVDLRAADSPLDLALKRGWLSEERHRAAAGYDTLFRRVLSTMPTLKVATAPSDTAIGAVLPQDGGRTGKSGVLTEIDVKLRDLAKLLEAGTITEGMYTRAEKKHRAAPIDWSRVPDKEIAAIFDAAADLHISAAALEIADPEFATRENERRIDQANQLREIWKRTTPDQARELFGVCVTGSWPQWINQRVAGKEGTSWERSRVLLEAGLDVVIAVMGEAASAKRTKGVPVPTLSEPAQAAPLGPKRVEYRFTYDETDGSLIREVIVKTRRPQDAN